MDCNSIDLLLAFSLLVKMFQLHTGHVDMAWMEEKKIHNRTVVIIQNKLVWADLGIWVFEKINMIYIKGLWYEKILDIKYVNYPK